MRGVQSALTVPLGAAGQETARAGIESLPEPLVGALRAGAEKFEGIADLAAEAFGPAAGAAVKTFPVAAGELFGFKLGRATLKAANKARRKGVKTLTVDPSGPSSDDVLEAASSVYRELDEAGAVIPRGQVRRIKAKVLSDVRAEAGPAYTDTRLRELDMLAGSEAGIKVSDLVALERRARQSVPAFEAGEVTTDVIRARQAVRDSITDAIDALDTAGVRGVENVGERLRMARNLHRRGSRSQAVMEALEKGRQGGEAGIRKEFKALISSKKKRALYTKPELEAIEAVARGSKSANLFRALSRLGVMEGGQARVLETAAGLGLGLGGGALFGGGFGAATGASMMLGIGLVSRPMAKRLTAQGARMADKVIRTSNGRELLEIYVRNTPVGDRRARDLASLLVRQDVDLDNMPADALSQEATRLALRARSRVPELAGAAIGGAATAQATQE